jgi:NAD(P)-dependent dehydrogenase (short-subunit alcohol dehydrogenase family)
MNFRDSVALVTRGNRGLGASFAQAALRQPGTSVSRLRAGNLTALRWPSALSPRGEPHHGRALVSVAPPSTGSVGEAP